MIFTAKGKLDNKTQLSTSPDTHSWAERSQGVKDSWQEFMFHPGITRSIIVISKHSHQEHMMFSTTQMDPICNAPLIKETFTNLIQQC